MPMRHFVLILTFHICCVGLFSQNSIRDVLNTLPDIKKKQSPALTALKVMLPCDFSDCISNGYIGISEPRMDSTKAYQQAYMRALSVYALQNSLARGMSDFFNDATAQSTSSNYEEFCELKSECNLAVSSIKVLNTIQLKSGEIILKLEIDSTHPKSVERIRFKSSVELYSKETEVDGNNKTNTKIYIKTSAIYSGETKGHSEMMSYYLSNNRWISQDLVYDSLKIDNSRFKLFYITEPNCKNDTTGFDDRPFGTTDGLWFAFANGIYSALSSQLKPQFLKMKQVGDRFENKLISLNRESGFFQFSSTLIGGIYVENNLYTKIKTEFPGR
ncbi:MAG: hypothetical protein WCG08_04240 [Paludibacter sp.]